MTPTTIAFTPGESTVLQPMPSEAGRRLRPGPAQIARHHAEEEFQRGQGVPAGVIRQLNRGRQVRLGGDSVALECSDNMLEIGMHNRSYALSLRSGAQSFTLVSHPETATLITHEGNWRYEGKVAAHLYTYASRLYAVGVRTREEHQAMMRRSHQQIAALGTKVKRMTETRVRKERASSRGPVVSAHDAGQGRAQNAEQRPEHMSRNVPINAQPTTRGRHTQN